MTSEQTSRRGFLTQVGKYATVGTGLIVLPEIYSTQAMSIEDVRFLADTATKFLRTVSKACDTLEEVLARVKGELSADNLRRYYGNGYHAESSLGAVAVKSLRALKELEFKQNVDPNYWRYRMEWESQKLLRPRLTSETAGVDEAQNDVTTQELIFVSALYKSLAEYEPYIPVTPRIPWRWPKNDEGKRAKTDFLRMYKGLLNHEIVNEKDRKTLTDDCLPIWYRWIYGGPGKIDVLSVKYVHVDKKKEFMWTFNRPLIDPKTREAGLKEYFGKSGVPT